MGTETNTISMLQINGNLDEIENYENFQNQIIIHFTENGTLCALFFRKYVLQ